jgi:hypothetical protein
MKLGKAFAAALALGTICLTGTLLIGRFYDKSLHLYSPRLIDLSGIDLSKRTMVPENLASVRWSSLGPAGVALFDPKEERFLVFPLGTGFDYPMSFEPWEMPPPSKRWASSLRVSQTYRFESSNGAKIRITTSDGSSYLGRIAISCERQGLEINYSSSDEQYLF